MRLGIHRREFGCDWLQNTPPHRDIAEPLGADGAVVAPKLRDAILSVLSTRTVNELLTPEGKEKLKGDILKAINDKVPEVDCKEIYFTEFLVQH